MELIRYPFVDFAKVQGGLHGRPAGSVAGVTYSSARTRLGKVVTAREKVSPANPRTAAQIIQRNKFSLTLFSTRHLTATLWQNDFNRAIGELPGFHSMQSIILNATLANLNLDPPPDTPLGNLHFPATFTLSVGAGASGTIDIDWSTELGLNGTVDDLLVAFGMKQVANVGNERPSITFISISKRSDASLTIDLDDVDQSYIVGSYFRGAGTADGLLTLARYLQKDTKA